MAGHYAKHLFRGIIMGPPGSGKGTVAQRIINNFDVCYFPTGDYLRREMRERTNLGTEAKKFIDRGHLVPDELVTQTLVAELKRHPHSNWLIDGFPRTIKQAQMLQRHCDINSVVELDVPFDVIIERVKHRWIHQPSGRVYNLGFNPPKVPGKDDVTGEPLVQRDDDRPEIVANRLRNYRTWEQPVSDYYRKRT